jgi:hypothetical protein
MFREHCPEGVGGWELAKLDHEAYATMISQLHSCNEAKVRSASISYAELGRQSVLRHQSFHVSG